MFNQLLKLIPEIKKYILNLEPVNFNKYILFLSGKDDYLFFEDVRKFSSKNKLHSYCSIKVLVTIVNIDNPSIFNNKVLEYLK